MNITAFADVPDKRLDEIRDATLRDTSLQTVVQLVLERWPQKQAQYSPVYFTLF